MRFLPKKTWEKVGNVPGKLPYHIRECFSILWETSATILKTDARAYFAALYVDLLGEDWMQCLFLSKRRDFL